VDSGTGGPALPLRAGFGAGRSTCGTRTRGHVEIWTASPMDGFLPVFLGSRQHGKDFRALPFGRLSFDPWTNIFAGSSGQSVESKRCSMGELRGRGLRRIPIPRRVLRRDPSYCIASGELQT
jgi:hypothetical protein